MPPDGQLSCDGLTLAANFDWVSSLPQVGRDFILASQAIAVPCTGFNLELRFATGVEACKESRPIRSIDFVSPMRRRGDSCFSQPRHIPKIVVFQMELRGLGIRVRNAGSSPRVAGRCRSVVAFSDFLAEYFKTWMPQSVKIHKVRYPFAMKEKPTADKVAVRRSLGLPPDAFVAFFHFDYNSGYDRKNPEGVLDAFRRSGLPAHKDAWLVIKTVGYDAQPVRAAGNAGENSQDGFGA